MQVTREEHQRRSGANMFINGGVAKNNHKNGGEKVRMRRLSKFTNPVLIAATAAAIMFLSAAPFAAGQEPGGLLLQGNGPGPAANEAGPGCNIIPPLASIGTKVNIKQFPPADSLTDAELAGPVQLLKSGKFDIPIEKLIKVNVPPGTPRGTITLPLFKGAVKTSSGLKPAWYIILDAGDKEEAERLGVNFSKKLHNAGDAARPATLRDDGTFLFESGLVDFSPNRQVQAGSQEKPFPPSIANPGSVGDADYSPLVRANGIVYDAPVIAAAVDDSQINFPNGDPDYGLVHDQVISIDPANRTVTLSLINGYSFGKPVFYISTESSDPTVSAIEGNTFASRLRKIENGVDDIKRSAVEWTADAISKGYRGLLTEEFRILKMARDGYITGPNGAPYGSFGPVIVCGVAARLN